MVVFICRIIQINKEYYSTIMKEETETETLNISELAKRFNLTRSTIVTRIEAAGIEPVFKKSREKIYEMVTDLDPLSGKSTMVVRFNGAIGSSP